MQRFGEKLRMLRLRRGMTFKKLATALGYAAASFVYEVEAGKKGPSVEFVIKVARLFGVSADSLLFDELELPEEASRADD